MLGGDVALELERVVEYCDGWMPILRAHRIRSSGSRSCTRA